MDNTNITTKTNGYITTTRPDGKVSFVLPEIAKTLSNKQVDEMVRSKEPEPVISETDKHKEALALLIGVLSKKTHGFSEDAKREYLVNNCDVDSFKEIAGMSSWGLICLMEKLEGK